MIIEKRQEKYRGLLGDIKKSLNSIRTALNSNKSGLTPIRIHSLELLWRQLSEAQEKCRSYIEYLNLYKSSIFDYQNAGSGQYELFMFSLPKEYPYLGKVLWIDKSKVENKRFTIRIASCKDINICVDDFNDISIPDGTRFPIMIAYYYNSCDYHASAERGMFKAYELSNTHVGTAATVKEIHEKYIVLIYQNSLKMVLNSTELINPNRFPPVHSELTVYPIKWEFNLQPWGKNNKNYPVTVSEKREDALSALEFESFPLCFSAQQLEDFLEFYTNSGLINSREELLLGPVNSDSISLKKGTLLKLQLGDIPLLILSVDEHNDRDDILKFYFKFERLCTSADKSFSADDIFVPFDVTFTPYVEGTSDEMIQKYTEITSIDDVTSLIWDVFEEFRTQYQIIRDRKGLGYYIKWENITSQLVNYLEQGERFLLDLKWEQSFNNYNCFAEIKNYKDLSLFLDSIASKKDALLSFRWRPQFFVNGVNNERFKAYLLDNGRGIRIVLNSEL